jgi:hypothetical protein
MVMMMKVKIKMMEETLFSIIVENGKTIKVRF